MTADRTFYSTKRLHVWLALASLALLVVTVWMVGADHYRPWKQYQRTFRAQIEPWLTEDQIRQPGFGKRLLRLPLIDAFGRPLAVDQIWLPELTLDYHFQQVARFDRCVTCHQGIDRSVPGLPLPYTSHPRLDLFVGAASPHPMAEFGCTICHDGQGSATDFRWASHTPDDPQQGADWRKAHGWSPNPHWDLPMLPRRFAESRCLKCHHEVSDLEPSRRFPDPPAPKLVAGFHLVRRYGCFACHEINGFGEGGRAVGPDLRLETAAAKPRAGKMRKVGPSLRSSARRSSRAVRCWTSTPVPNVTRWKWSARRWSSIRRTLPS